MKKTYRIVTFCTFFLLIISNLHAGSPVWKISKAGNHLFIGGTIHILSPSDYPLPEVFEKTYHQSSIIVFETDILRLQQPDFQHYTMAQLSNTEGVTLKSILSTRTYQALESHLQERSISISQLEPMKPGLVCVTLAVVELSRLGLMGTGVDEYFTLRAINDNRDRIFLETPEEQIAFIATLGKGTEDQLIEYTLKDMGTLPQVMKMLKSAWRTGDLKTLETLSIKPLSQKFPQIHQQLFTDRNAAWMPRIERMLTTEPIEFILVGAAHLPGKEGLLKRLAAKGYTVEQQ